MSAIAWFAVGVVALTDVAEPIRASFDCAQAASVNEQAICTHAQLADIDRRLGLIFAELRRSAGTASTADALRASQRAWLVQRDSECTGNLECLQSHYAERIGELLRDVPAFDPEPALTPRRIDSAMHVFDAITPDELQEAATSQNREFLGTLSCHYFERKPRDAERLFGPYFGSLRDGWQPLCRTLDVAQAIPQTAPLLASLAAAAGSSGDMRCDGSIQNYYWRGQSVARILALVDAKPDIDAAAEAAARRVAELGYSPDLAHWAQQGLWQKRLAARIEQESAQARSALQAYYRQHFALSRAPAQRLAAYHVRRIVDAYVGRTGHGSTGEYASACYGKDDLDHYIDSGELPARACPNAQYIDTSPPGLHGFLLTLALVDDYPLPVVQRLIDAGAPLNPDTKDSGETPLMRAAARADAIAALLEAGADPNRSNAFGKTALMYAVAEKNLAGVQALIAAGADVNAATFTDLSRSCDALKAGGRSVLIYAAWQSTPEIIAVLLDAGADREARDTKGEAALDYLRRNEALSGAQREAIARKVKTPK